MKQITITVPDNCELKQDGNTYTIVKKEKKLTYADVARELFSSGNFYFISEYGNTLKSSVLSVVVPNNRNNCTSKKQAEKLLAINKLMNVAKYLNGNWQPNWLDNNCKYFIYYSNINKRLEIDNNFSTQFNIIYFKSIEFAKQAIEILGEETIKLALCADY